MTREFLNNLTQRYHVYVDGYRQADGSLSQLLQLKVDHTLSVIADARRIMDGERWGGDSRMCGEACALLHDVGRYSQVSEYGTFEDAKSIDHAVRGVEVIESAGWLAELDAPIRKRILTAVASHNKKEVAPALDTVTAELCHLVRDADKLDIFRVLEQAVGDGSLERNPEIAWGLQVKGAPSPNVAEAVVKGQAVSYTWIKTLSDFVLIQVGWMNGGLHYRTAVRLVREREALDFREDFLKTLSDDPAVAACCAAARAHMAQRLDRLDA